MNDNIVIITHNKNDRYLFTVPSGVQLKKGDLVKVNTRKGETYGECVCDSFSVAENVTVALAAIMGGKVPLKPVIGIYSVFEFAETLPY